MKSLPFRLGNLLPGFSIMDRYIIGETLPPLPLWGRGVFVHWYRRGDCL